MDNYNLPKKMCDLRQFLNYRNEPDKSGRNMKVPYSPTTGRRASASDPSTWGTLEEALLAKEKYLFSGMGLFLRQNVV